VHGKRRLVHGAPARPGVYLFRDRLDQVLYVGKARDLRARLRSYFQTGRQRPSVEAALGAVEKVEWRLCGSELAAALEEVRLIRELRPPANHRTPRPEQYLYLRRQGDDVVAGKLVTPYGPLRNRSVARRAARALAGCSDEEFERLLDGGPLERLQARMRDLSESLRYEDAARLRDRIESLERVLGQLRRLERLRRLELCLTAPALEDGWREAFFVAGGRVACRRTLPPGGGRLELEAGASVARAARRDGRANEPDHADELLVVGGFLERPPPELEIRPLLLNREEAA
jgi:excinuclease UvrABC nuclease subunit